MENKITAKDLLDLVNKVEKTIYELLHANIEYYSQNDDGDPYSDEKKLWRAIGIITDTTATIELIKDTVMRKVLESEEEEQ